MIIAEIVVTGFLTISSEEMDDNLEWLQKQLSDYFGGWIKTYGYSGWKINGDYVNMRCCKYEIAIDNINTNIHLIKELAEEMKIKCKQKQIMIVIQGEASFL